MNDHVNTSFSEFWLDKASTYKKSDDPSISELLNFASIQGAIQNFVKIVTGKNIPVRFNTKTDASATDGRKVVVSADTTETNFDSTVGLALHEAAHILLSDFELLRELEKHIPAAVFQAADKLGIKNTPLVISIVHRVLNVIEDRRIDYFMYKTAPGYRGYYQAMYKKYWHSDSVTEGLKSGSFRNEQWNDYDFRFVNLSNPDSDLDALKGLRRISELVDLPNIGRLNTSEDTLLVAIEVAKVIFKHISIPPKPKAPKMPPMSGQKSKSSSGGDKDDKEQELDENNMPDGSFEPVQGEESQKDADEKKEDENLYSKDEIDKASPAGDKDSEEKEEDDAKGSGKDSEEKEEDDAKGSGKDSEEKEEDDSTEGSKSDFEDDSEQTPPESGDAPVETPPVKEDGSTEEETDPETGATPVTTPVTPEKLRGDEEEAAKEAFQKQINFLNGDIEKEAMDELTASNLDTLNDSKASLEDVKFNYLGENVSVPVIFIRNVSDDFFASELCAFASKDFCKDGIGDLIPGTYDEEIQQGIALGRLLGRHLQIRNDVKKNRSTRKSNGRIVRRLLHEAGLGNQNVFGRIYMEQYKKAEMHITIDLSSSMSGSKLGNALITVTAIAMFASMTKNIGCVISVRYADSTKEDTPVIAVMYDSKVDKFSKIRRMLPYLVAIGCTPEGLTFAAIADEIVSSSQNVMSYFINFSDGAPMCTIHKESGNIDYQEEPSHLHTKAQVEKLRHRGIKVQSFFIKSESRYTYDDKAWDAFRIMYGRDAVNIKPGNLPELAKALEEMFLEKDN